MGANWADNFVYNLTCSRMIHLVDLFKSQNHDPVDTTHRVTSHIKEVVLPQGEGYPKGCLLPATPPCGMP